MHLIKKLNQENYFLVKINLKDACVGIPVDKISRKYICFQWEVNLCKLLCIYFVLGLSPLIFTKTSEDPSCLIKENQCKKNNFFGFWTTC